MELGVKSCRKIVGYGFCCHCLQVHVNMRVQPKRIDPFISASRVRARKLGRQIAKKTSIPFTAAMRIGKLLIQGRQHTAMEKYPGNVDYVTHCDCCGPILYFGTTDAKGTFHAEEQVYANKFSI